MLKRTKRLFMVVHPLGYRLTDSCALVSLLSSWVRRFRSLTRIGMGGSRLAMISLCRQCWLCLEGEEVGSFMRWGWGRQLYEKWIVAEKFCWSFESLYFVLPRRYLTLCSYVDASTSALEIRKGRENHRESTHPSSVRISFLHSSSLKIEPFSWFQTLSSFPTQHIFWSGTQRRITANALWRSGFTTIRIYSYFSEQTLGAAWSLSPENRLCFGDWKKPLTRKCNKYVGGVLKKHGCVYF